MFYGRMSIALVFLVGLLPSARGQVPLQRDDAANFPSRHAWNLFLNVNHPAKIVSEGRGLPDPSKPIGEPGTTVVWETWRLSEKEVFLDGGAKPPAWDDTSLPGSPTSGKVPELPKAIIVAFSSVINGGMASVHSSLRPMFDPDEGIFQGIGGFGESRMNRATYEFIVNNGLYSRQGQQRYAAAYLRGEKPLLSFPLDSVEVKGAWIELTSSQLAAGDDRRFYLAEWNGKKYGLTSLHIITKDLPNWFWCTFHHRTAPATGAETPDMHGMPDVLRGTVWENYKLGGTQIDFVDSIGRPTLLSDPYIEKGFEQSSCITCHARASVGPDDSQSGLGSRPDIGVPDPQWFLDGDKEKIMQTDFLFSLPFRAKSEATVATTASASTTHIVTIKDFEFEPRSLEVKVGDSIVWRNDGKMRHTATRDDAPAFNTGILQSGTSSAPIRVVGPAGEYEYLCSPHPFMKGVLRVTATTTPVVSPTRTKASHKTPVD